MASPSSSPSPSPNRFMFGQYLMYNIQYITLVVQYRDDMSLLYFHLPSTRVNTYVCS